MIEAQIIEAWRINNRVNMRLLSELSSEQIAATLSTRGGRTVGQQYAHMLWVRINRIERIDKTLLESVSAINRDNGEDIERMLKGFESTGAVFEKIISTSFANEGKVKSFKRGIVPMVGYFISHESHHRGHMLLTLKQSKLNLDSRFRMSLWEWNKI